MIVRVSVKPGAKKEKVEKKGEKLLVAVREPAEHNRANARVRQLVADVYGVPVARVRFLSGQHASSKKFDIIT